MWCLTQRWRHCFLCYVLCLHEPSLTDLNKAYWSVDMHYSCISEVKAKCLPWRNAKHAASWCTKQSMQMLGRFYRLPVTIVRSYAFILEFISCLFSFVSSLYLVSLSSVITVNALISPTGCLFATFNVSKFWDWDVFTSLLHYLCRGVKKILLYLNEC